MIALLDIPLTDILPWSPFIVGAILWGVVISWLDSDDRTFGVKPREDDHE